MIRFSTPSYCSNLISNLSLLVLFYYLLYFSLFLPIGHSVIYYVILLNNFVGFLLMICTTAQFRRCAVMWLYGFNFSIFLLAFLSFDIIYQFLFKHWCLDTFLLIQIFVLDYYVTFCIYLHWFLYLIYIIFGQERIPPMHRHWKNMFYINTSESLLKFIPFNNLC